MNDVEDAIVEGITEVKDSESVEKLKAMIEKEKIDHGLIGFHFDVGLTSGASAGQVAREIVEMHEAYLAGKFIDITDHVL
jgi:hypothetical protein